MLENKIKIKKKIFLSYARPDKKVVENIYRKLSDAGFEPWMDTKDILPGEIWIDVIIKNIREASFFIIFLSENSIDKRGVIQKEIKEALDVWKQKLNSDIFLIPVRLDDCNVPEILTNFQWVDLFEKKGFSKLIKSINEGIKRSSKDDESKANNDSENHKTGNSREYHKIKITIIIGIVSFLIGILGNLTSVWIQQQLLKEIFTLPRIAIILLLVIFSISVSALVQSSKPISLSYIKRNMNLIIAMVIIFVFIVPFGIKFLVHDNKITPQLSYLELNLATGFSQKRIPNSNGMIYLTSDEISGLNSLSGRAVIKYFSKSDTCEFWAKTQHDTFQKFSTKIGDCKFSFNLPNRTFENIYFKFKIKEKDILVTIIIRQ